MNDGSSTSHKEAILAMMEKSGSLSYTAEVLAALAIKVQRSVEDLERNFGIENNDLRCVLKRLDVSK